MVAASILVWSLPAASGDAFGRSASAFREALADILCDVELADVRVGVAVADLESGEIVFGHNLDELFNPASVSKLFTVATALEVLRPEYRFPTVFRAEKEIDDSRGGPPPPRPPAPEPPPAGVGSSGTGQRPFCGTAILAVLLFDRLEACPTSQSSRIALSRFCAFQTAW